MILHSFEAGTDRCEYVATVYSQDNKCHMTAQRSCHSLFGLAKVFSSTDRSKVLSESTPIKVEFVEFKEWHVIDNKIKHVVNVIFTNVVWTEARCSMDGEMTPCWGLGSFNFKTKQEIPVEDGETVDVASKYPSFDLRKYFESKHREFLSRYGQQDVRYV